MFRSFTFADYFFTKTLLFARKNLQEEEYRLFQKLFTVLNSSFPKPELLVYFHRNVPILLKQIDKRGRSYEKNISAEYLTQIQNSYFEYFRNILSFPVLIIDLDEINFVERKEVYAELKNLIKREYNPGVHRVTMHV